MLLLRQLVCMYRSCGALQPPLYVCVGHADLGGQQQLIFKQGAGCVLGGQGCALVLQG
jgi:hypothetical protein